MTFFKSWTREDVETELSKIGADVIDVLKQASEMHTRFNELYQELGDTDQALANHWSSDGGVALADDVARVAAIRGAFEGFNNLNLYSSNDTSAASGDHVGAIRRFTKPEARRIRNRR